MPIYELDDLTPSFPADSSHWIAPTAVIVGDVRLAEQVSIWFGTVLRGDTEPLIIGKGSNIQENTVVHADPGLPTVIGENCTIGHKAMIHGCTIEDGCLIGMGATILNGAVIGAGSIIGAGALVPERKVIPANSLVMGIPGKVVREVDEDMRVRNIRSAESYQARAAHYREHLKQI